MELSGWKNLQKKTFIDRVLWAILGSMSCSTKSGSFLGLCWARLGLVVGQTLTFDIKHLKKHHNFAVLNAQRSIVICFQTNCPDLGAVRCSMGVHL